MCRFARLTNAFSEKLENHANALALYFVWRNFCRIRRTLTGSPAKAEGAKDELLRMANFVPLIDAMD
jgi:hypothetical protein